MTIKAVLLDLDNTLLHNPDYPFARAFLSAFEEHFSTRNILDAGTRFREALVALTVNRTGTIVNDDVIVAHLGGEAGSVSTDLRQFYADRYQRLQGCVRPVAGAAELIHRLRAMDMAVVIATNPIYPAEAIEARMRWADLPVEDDLYALVTSSDVMHFSKPDLAYYAEILGRIGVEPDEALMIGDRLESDINPAAQVGLHTIHCDHSTLLDTTYQLRERLSQMTKRSLQPTMIEPQLRGNIGALYGFLAHIKPSFWLQRPDTKEWSIVQILCHLADFEDRNERPRLETILCEDNPFITQPPEPGPDIEACATEGYTPAREFVEAREKTIAFIQQLSDDAWRRPARHSIFGLTTLLEMAYFTAQHDRLHLNQLCQTIGRCT